MKNILFILSLVIWCGCSNEIPFDTNRAEDMTVTRTTNSDSVYYFEGYFSQLQPVVTLPYKKDSIRQTIVSYRQVGTTVADIVPEVVSKPTWVNRIDFLNPYYKIYEVFISVDANTSVEKRVGSIILKQPESNKTLNNCFSERTLLQSSIVYCYYNLSRRKRHYLQNSIRSIQ